MTNTPVTTDTSTAATLHGPAHHLVTPGLVSVFEAEIDNESNGGINPATLSSTIDSIAQGLLGAMEVLGAFDDTDVQSLLVSLLLLRDMLPGDTQVRTLLPE